MRVPTRQVGNKKGVRPWPFPLQNRLSWGHCTRFWGQNNYPQRSGTRPDHVVEHRAAGIPRCVGGHRWRHTSPHVQVGRDGSARIRHLLYCTYVQYTSKMFGWGEEGNKRYAPHCPRGGGSKIPFEILIHWLGQRDPLWRVRFGPWLGPSPSWYPAAPCGKLRVIPLYPIELERVRA